MKAPVPRRVIDLSPTITEDLPVGCGDIDFSTTSVLVTLQSFE